MDRGGVFLWFLTVHHRSDDISYSIIVVYGLFRGPGRDRMALGATGHDPTVLDGFLGTVGDCILLLLSFKPLKGLFVNRGWRGAR